MSERFAVDADIETGVERKETPIIIHAAGVTIVTSQDVERTRSEGSAETQEPVFPGGIRSLLSEVVSMVRERNGRNA